MSPAEAARNLLVTLAPNRPVPAGLDARTGLLRSLLAGRRVLLVLDNARDADHVRPLLPGTGGCAVLVTSRDRLTGLVASHGALPVSLGALDDEQATDLLAGRLGAGRLAADPCTVATLLEATAGLPLALVTVAARAALRAGQPLAELAAEISGAGLDGLRGPDEATDPGSVFSWSYRALSPAAARLFRLFGAFPGPDISMAALSSLAGEASKASAERVPGEGVAAREAAAEELAAGGVVGEEEKEAGRAAANEAPAGGAAAETAAANEAPAEGAAAEAADGAGAGRAGTRQSLAELVAANLISEHRPGRFVMHDLLRAYAAGLLTPGERGLALNRLLDHHLHTGHAAALRLDPQREPLTLPPPSVTPEPIVDEAAALEWLGAEHDNLMALIRTCGDVGDYGWQLPWVLIDFLDRQGHWDDWIAVEEIAVAAARRRGQARAEALAQRVLARGYVQLGRYDEAEPHYAEADRLYQATGDPVGEAHTLFSISWMREQQGRYDDCLRHTTRALELYRAAGHRVGEARALNALGWYLGHHGRYDLTLRHCRPRCDCSTSWGTGTAKPPPGTASAGRTTTSATTSRRWRVTGGPSSCTGPPGTCSTRRRSGSTSATRTPRPPTGTPRAGSGARRSRCWRSSTTRGPPHCGPSSAAEAFRIAGADPQDLRGALGQVDHGGRLGAALAGVDDRVHRVVQGLLDLPALGHRLRFAGQQQGAGDQWLTEFGQDRLGGGVRGDAYPHGLLLGVQQPPRHLLGGRQNEGVRPRRGRLHRAEQRIVDLHELSELREVVAHQGEVVPVVQMPDRADPVQPVLVAHPAAERETRIGRIGDQPVRANQVHDLVDAPRLRIVRVHVEILRHSDQLRV